MLLSGIANCCECLKSFSSIYSRYAVRILLVILMLCIISCFQMATRSQNQVVRLTRCIGVPGHMAMLVRVMVETGYRWYPEYTVEEQFNARSDHWATLTRFAPAVQAGFMDMRDIYPVRCGLPECMEWRDVGGITPPRGPRLPPFVGPRPHPSPYGPQAPQDRLFPDDHVQLPGHGGDFYEDYYGDV